MLQAPSMSQNQTDRSMINDVARTLAVPRRDDADSFVLHASLELMARAALLPLTRLDARDAVRERLRWLAAEYEAAGEPVDPPRPVRPDPDRLVAALADGDLDEVDAQVVALAEVSTAVELRAALAEPVARSLAAAGHGSILLDLLTRVGRSGPLPLGLARQALREMARHPSWQLSWFDQPAQQHVGQRLADVLLEVPHLGSPGSNFIYPVMRQAEESGLVSRVLAGIAEEPRAVERALARVAAWSMVQEPPDHAPYGWSHCLTMAQATVRLADVTELAVPVAATYVVGFRAGFGVATLDPSWRPHPTAPEAGVWADPSRAAVADLASYAAAHEDAHLAKYTLACIDAAARDPAARRLHLSAAAHLAAWWQERATIAA
jgi:hypothetical protein